MRHKKKIVILICILIVLLIINFKTQLLAKSEIYAVGCLDNYPYEYLNEEGIPSGFSVDLINQISAELKVKCRIELVPYDRLIFMKKNPDVDIVLGMIRGNPSEDFNFFKTNVKIHFSIFAESDSSISSINDLQNLTILIAAHDFLAHPIHEELNKFLKFKSIVSDSEMNAFTLLKSNKCDAVFMSGTSAQKIIQNQHLIGIKELPVSIGFFDYGFGISKKKDDVKKIMSIGYTEIFENGKYAGIYNKWFISGSDNSFLNETGVYLSAGIFSFIVFIFFLLINSFILRKRIKEKTDNLNLSMIELGKAQVQLRESEKRFRRIFNQSPSALMILNPSGKVLMFNNAVIEIFGVNNPPEIINLDVINSPVSTEWFKTRLKDYRNVNIEVRFNFEIIRNTGYFSTSKTGIMILELIIMPVEINSGSPEKGYICQFSDNTQSKLLMEEIKYNQRKLEQIFDGIKDGLWEWNLLNGKVRYNRKFFTFLGYKMEQFPDDINTLLGFIHENDRESVKNELFDKVYNGRSFNIGYKMVMSNGRIINVRSKGETIEWDDNLKPLRVIGIQSEITVSRDICNRINFFNDGIKKSSMGSPGLNTGVLKGRTILLADDNYLIYLHVSELLKKYSVTTVYASSGEDAIDAVASGDDISLIILDHNMPELDGGSALKEIRKLNYNIPVIIQTGESVDDINNYMTKEGISGVLGKPIDEQVLIETLCGVFEKKI